ncbi:DUF6705 family protein [Chryseobacterium camelliae]|uniref:DUF6705 family protein n=1 Tax=Chryseobacterium camelliae TaxID=1265445 RepID=UPI000C1C8A3F|nr:DUF6705 family protein [Chryseobacterium camelliae]
MKKTSIILILLISLTLKGQTIIDINDSTYSNWSNNDYNYYKKDMHNLLDIFQGTYIYTNGNTSFKIILKKMIKQPEGLHYEDMIIGEYQYVENGTEKINTLSNLDISYSNQFLKHGIAGNGIIANIYNRLWKCPQCNPNEKRLILRIRDKSTDRYANMILRRTTIDNKEVLQVKINNINGVTYDVEHESPPANFSLPIGEFTMKKL